MKHIIGTILIIVTLTSCTQVVDPRMYKNIPSTYDIRTPTLVLPTLDAIKTYQMNNIWYNSDSSTYGRPEYWAAPQQTIEERLGDCEDIAIFVGYFANKLGYKVRLVGVELSGYGSHMLVELDGVLYEAQALHVNTKYVVRVIDSWTLDEALSICYNYYGSRNVGSGQ